MTAAGQALEESLESEQNPDPVTSYKSFHRVAWAFPCSSLSSPLTDFDSLGSSRLAFPCLLGHCPPHGFGALTHFLVSRKLSLIIPVLLSLVRHPCPVPP